MVDLNGLKSDLIYSNKLEKEEERLMNEISALEEKKSQLEYQLSLPAVYSDGAKSRKIQQEIEETAAAIEKTTAQWEEVSAQLENAN